jgi:methylmalonyl-CoA/ethylmalonyl-CoA epimerase
MYRAALTMHQSVPFPGKIERLPMSPIQLDHIAIALSRIGDAPAALVAVLGGVPEEIRSSVAFRWATWRFAGGGRIEILEPAGPDGFLHRFLATHGPGVHHVTFTVPSLALACERADSHGYRIVGRDESDPAWKEAFLHPRQALGIVVQLAEPAPSAPTDRPVARSPGMLDPPPPVRILGLRLRARSAAAALTQWREVLHGATEPAPGGGLVFRWPDSPMRIAVEVDPTGTEGPVAIELAAEHPVGGLEAAGARLGIPLVQRSA